MTVHGWHNGHPMHVCGTCKKVFAMRQPVRVEKRDALGEYLASVCPECVVQARQQTTEIYCGT